MRREGRATAPGWSVGLYAWVLVLKKGEGILAEAQARVSGFTLDCVPRGRCVGSRLQARQGGEVGDHEVAARRLGGQPLRAVEGPQALLVQQRGMAGHEVVEAAAVAGAAQRDPDQVDPAAGDGLVVE